MKFSKKLLRMGIFFLVLVVIGSSNSMATAKVSTNRSDTVMWDVQVSHPYVQKGRYAD